MKLSTIGEMIVDMLADVREGLIGVLVAGALGAEAIPVSLHLAISRQYCNQGLRM